MTGSGRPASTASHRLTDPYRTSPHCSQSGIHHRAVVRTQQGTLLAGPARAVELPAVGRVVKGDKLLAAPEGETYFLPYTPARRLTFGLEWDLREKATGDWLSETDGVPPSKHQVTAEYPTSDQLGLEDFHSYAGKNTGAGSALMSNLHAGNAVWSYNAFSNPSLGFSTFLRLATTNRTRPALRPVSAGRCRPPRRSGSARRWTSTRPRCCPSRSP
ncbi:hypothetical protein [Streptomyces deccanensis]|uniref:hypothetical protein n=1 Tax=Streptomyces deccanensis TaxID=424188 RepID=UPI001EFBA738|nr:hypothetical protein [Streptomyces deccanensis]ULR49744.1 hypothetical protein L3078_10790 [Streptomyces deccanensis]